MIGTGIDVAIGLFLCLAFSHYTELARKAEKAFKWISAGAVSFLLAGVFELTPIISGFVTAGTLNYGFALFAVVGWILVMIGALWALYQLLTE